MLRMRFIGRSNWQEFEVIRHEVQRVVERACHGEFTTADVEAMIQGGTAFAGYVGDDASAVHMAGVWELLHYPRMLVVNVMAMGGSGFKVLWPEFGPVLKSVWRKQGAAAWQCEASPAMTKLLQKSGTGIEAVYITSREKL